MGKKFITLTHPNTGDSIAVRKDLVVLVESIGGEITLVSVEGEDSFMCSETVEEVLELLDS